MTHTITVTHRLEKNKTEYDALKVVMRMLNEVREEFGDYATLTSPVTGECIEMNDIPLVNGILDGFLTQDVWTVE